MLKENEIYLGDCLDLMKELPDKSIDCVITDPPYGIARFGNRVELSNRTDSTAHINKWDIKPTQECFNEIFRISKTAIIWGMNNFTLPQTEYFIVWDKMQTVDNFASAELAWTNIKQPAKVYRYSIHQEMKNRQAMGGKLHPTQKPISLMKWILQNYTNENDLILDPFLGSGTTAIACADLKRRYIGIEKEPKYYEIAKKRIADFNMQVKLF